MTSTPKKTTLVAVGVLLVSVFVGCDRTSDGVAVRADAPAPASSGATRPSTTGTTAPSQPSTSAPMAVPGIETTLPDTMPPNALICLPDLNGAGAAAAGVVGDPAAPRITVEVPPEWTSTPGRDDVALMLRGPDGMTGQVTIAATKADPAGAFAAYGDAIVAHAAVSVLNVMPAEFCGFSSQRLFGTWSDQPGQAVGFADRITHIWTNTGNYLVIVHLEGPSGAAGFDAAKTVLMADYPIVIP